jgi:peptide/nickel transport system substrate-binding protein
MSKKSFKLLGIVLVLVLALSGISATAQEGDTLNLLYWQAISTMNPYLSGGTKDLHAASLSLEPLARYDENSNLVPWLAESIPTLENGGVSADQTQITWVLKEGLLWSDGSPVTSADVVFTWTYCTTPETGCTQTANFTGVVSVEATDERTVVITFDAPKSFPYAPFVGQTGPILQAAQFAACVGEAAASCTDQNFMPVGTGPYIVTEFRANDVVTLGKNPYYRVEGQPYFETVVLKGGGDAEAAARGVLSTGEADYAWNLQVAPAILGAMEAEGNGTIVSSFATGVERLELNQTNPDPALGDMRSVTPEEGGEAHPFLTIPAVYQALSMAIDRQVIVDTLYGAGGRPTCNVLAAPDIYYSPNNESCLTQDIAGANALLDEAGIVDTDGDNIREANGIPLRVLYQTSTNAVRQGAQALIKDWWAQIGVEAELRDIDAGVFFGADPASPDTFGKFYADIQMFTNTFDGNDPEAYLSNWTCAQMSAPSNQFNGQNIVRYCNEEYDALVTEMAQTTDLERRIELAMAMNDILIQNGVIIPLVHRASVSAHSNTIEGVRMNAWDSELWNIAEWTRAS